MSFLLGEKGFHASFLFTTVAFTFLFFVVGAIALLRQAFICGQPGKREHRSLQIIFLTIKTSILSNRGRLLFELIGYFSKMRSVADVQHLSLLFLLFYNNGNGTIMDGLSVPIIEINYKCTRK